MINRTLRLVAWGVCATSVLSACGGSGGDGQTAGIDRTGSPVLSIAALGTVTAFGSVVVNGVRYDTSSAQFTVDDSPGSQSDLAVGDVLLVRGSVDATGTVGIATAVIFDDQVQGPIASIDATASTLVVLGQTVRVTADTSFDDRIQPRSLEGLRVGDLVEVSGLVQSDGSIDATRVEPKPAGTELELTGVVSNHDSVARRFNINAQVVNYTAVAQLQDFPSGTVGDGQTVEVKGGAVTAGIWQPSRIEFQANGLTGAAGDRREVEGFITRFGSATDFTVAGLAVLTNGQTSFTGGQAADLGLNVKVEVEGTLNAGGVLVATKVDIRRSSAVRVVTVIESVNAAGNSFVVLGITVRIDAITRLEDKSSQQTRPFGIANLAAGNYVEVRGVEQPAGGGEILATLVERDDPDAQSELQGFVQAVAQQNFTILGVQIGTDGSTSYRNAADAPLTAAQFFAELSAGDLVKAKGIVVGARALQAEEAEFEN